MTSGYTENQRYRPLGINAYGFNPYTATEEEGNTEHGNDERIRVEEVRRGCRGFCMTWWRRWRGEVGSVSLTARSRHVQRRSTRGMAILPQ